MKLVCFTLMIGGLGVLTSTPLYAHSGGLNADGCHAGSQPYHCHRAQTRSAPARRTNSGAFIDRNCSDFGSWQAAQLFFENAGPNDPHGLDADHDGIACESLR